MFHLGRVALGLAVSALAVAGGASAQAQGRLPNGNTLLNFGFRADDPSEPGLLVEARPDGTAAWEQRQRWIGLRFARYRAYPLTTLAGELPTEPTPISVRP